jgi:hypothetical protein
MYQGVHFRGCPLFSGSQHHLGSPVEQQGGIGLLPRLF